MKRAFFLAALGLLVLGLTSGASAQTATQVVNFSVASFQQITVAAGPVALNVSTWTGGGDALDQASGASTYSILQNVGNSRITAHLDSDMPAGTTLEVRLTPSPTKGTSSGYVILTSSAADVASGVQRGADNGRPIDYRLSANASAGPVSGTRTVTFTLVSP